MEKDIITIKQTDGTTKEMEAILTFEDAKTNINYILYKDLNNTTECYAAKYTKNGDLFKMDTNLTKTEIKMLEIILANTLEANENEN